MEILNGGRYMLLTLDDMNFISQATFGGKNGQLVAKTDLLEEKERLLDVDERNLITYGAHLILNHIRVLRNRNLTRAAKRYKI